MADEPIDVTLITSFGDAGGGSELVVAPYLDHCRQALKVRAIVLQHGPFGQVLEGHGAEVTIFPTGASPLAILATGPPAGPTEYIGCRHGHRGGPTYRPRRRGRYRTGAPRRALAAR